MFWVGLGVGAIVGVSVAILMIALFMASKDHNDYL